MADTIEQRVVDALMGALRDASIRGVEHRIFERRGVTLTAEDLPAIDVAVQEAALDVLEVVDATLQHRLRVSVDVVTRETVGHAPDREARRVAADAHGVLFADSSLAALARALTPISVRYASQESGAGVVLRRACVYEIDFVTEVEDLTAQP